MRPAVVAQMNTERRATVDVLNAGILRSRRFIVRAVRIMWRKSPRVMCRWCAVISIELSGDMERFYDKIRVMKGPSFGTCGSRCSAPFMYLAHYDLVTTAPGRAFLASVGLDPELIRISIGAEDYASIEAVFAEALDFCLL